MSQDQQDQITEHGTDPTDAATSVPLAVARPGAGTMLPDWVALSGISARAQALYWQLAVHLNRRRGDRVVFPSRQNLAARLGFSQARTIDRYLTELIEVGAIDKRTTRTSGMRSRNFYVLHLQPRPGYQGPRTLADTPWAEPDDTPQADEITDHEGGSRPFRPVQETPGSAQTRTTQVRKHAPQESACAHPNQKNLNHKNHHHQGRVNTAEVVPGRGESTSEDRARQVVVEEARHLLRTLPQRVNLSESAIQHAAPWVARALEDGWPGDRLRAELTRDLHGARNIPGVIISRLHRLPPPPLPELLTQKPAAPRACPDHPGAARRSDGECAGCWADKHHRR
ncbi:helix-turn-helix domain-containing protein [Actinomadura syzygii]|uniref:Helix-turn-helix domain-containing protein n=1 Tax=Actinomadura syzygii TaxID=1427538 RepID=A0A5D0TWK7_9ACTN|nr:helix-turn-helix domain-containing protein [Actinomadura syzygii]TYC10043.1 helix-turn-helix domain-containing protein [Actinomadura syzygii]